MRGLEPAARRTFHLELLRAPAVGILETAFATFSILFLVKVFEAGSTPKALLLSSGRAGFIASILIVPLLYRSGLRTPTLVALIHSVGGLGFLGASVFHDSLWGVAGGLSLGLFSFTLQTPLFAEIYRVNYPDEFRGRLFSKAGLVRTLATVVFSFIGGKLLSHDLSLYRLLLFAFAFSSFYSAILFFRIPFGRENGGSKTNPPPRRPLFSAFRWLKEDREFRVLIASWMVLGIGNLMAVSLFVDYLANADIGLGLTAGMVAILTGVVAPLFKLATTYSWGDLFDRLDFYWLRILLNLVLAVMILCFFLGGTIGIWVAMALHGVGMAGGNVMWSLWVTKLAPPDRVSEYMSVHTFMTGLRGTATPFLAYFLLARLGVSWFAITCAVLVVVAALMLLPRALRGPTEKPTLSKKG